MCHKLGGIQQLHGQNFLYPERGQKQTFLDPLTPHLVHVVIEWPPGGWAMFSIHARNSSLQIDPLTLTVFDHFASFFCQLFSKLGCLGGERTWAYSIWGICSLFFLLLFFFVLRHPVLLKLPNTGPGRRREVFLGRPMMIWACLV